MLILPSGRAVELSIHRARYHALRRHGPGPEARHRQLYALVDILYRYEHSPGKPCRGWTEFDLHYSPYTLDQIPHAADWDEADKQALLAWALEPTQRRLIDSARQRLSPQQARLSVKQSHAPRQLYSLLQQRLQALPLTRASVSQWQATLDNMQGQGLRQEELYWSGVQRFLQQLPKEQLLLKQQLLEALDLRQLRLELCTEQIEDRNGSLGLQEVAQRMQHQAVYRAALKLDESRLCILRYRDRHNNYRIGVVKDLRPGRRMGLNKVWFALDPYGRAIKDPQQRHLYHSSDDAIAAANHHARQQPSRCGGRRFHSQYDHLSLYGGHDYREWTISLADHPRIFFGAHHLDHNVLAHVRTTTRQDQLGRKLLFIEELQSDWHQAGRRYGYDNSPWGRIAHAPFKQEWPHLVVKLMLIRASQNGYDGIAWPQGEIQELRYGKPLPAIRRRYDEELPTFLTRLCSGLDSGVEHTRIDTCDPWLTLVREQGRWRVEDPQGKFKTRTRYADRDTAMAVLYRHSRRIQLQVPVLWISDALRWQIAERGLPLFGHTLE